MHPSIKQLKFEGNAWKYAKEEGMDATRIMTGEVDYLEPHGDGKVLQYWQYPTRTNDES